MKKFCIPNIDKFMNKNKEKSYDEVYCEKVHNNVNAILEQIYISLRYLNFLIENF